MAAVAGRSTRSLGIAVGAVDTITIAQAAFERIRANHPRLEMIPKADSTELSFDIPVQARLKHRLNINLQNVDELHFTVGHLWVEWFPCTDPTKVDEFVDAVSGFIAGRLRVLEHYRGHRCVKAELQAPEGDGWRTIHTWVTLSVPIPWRVEQRVISNA